MGDQSLKASGPKRRIRYIPLGKQAPLINIYIQLTLLVWPMY